MFLVFFLSFSFGYECIGFDDVIIVLKLNQANLS